MVHGIETRSKRDWFEYGIKSSIFFSKLKKTLVIQGKIRTIVSNERDISDDAKILKHISINQSTRYIYPFLRKT